MGEGKKGGFASGGRKGERRHQTRVKGSTKIISPPSKWPCEPTSCILKWNPRVVLHTVPSNSHPPSLQRLFLSPFFPSFLSFSLSLFLSSLVSPLFLLPLLSLLFFSQLLHLPLPLRLSLPCAAVFHVASERPDVGKVEGSADSLTITSRRTKSRKENERNMNGARESSVRTVSRLQRGGKFPDQLPSPNYAITSPLLRWKFRGINRSLRFSPLPPIRSRERKARAATSS